MQSWMVSLVIAMVGLVASFAVMRKTGEDNARRLDGIGKKVDEHSEELSNHKVKVNSMVTMEQVRHYTDMHFEKKVDKEIFNQHERHIDKRFHEMDRRFDDLERHINERITIIEKKIDDGFDEIKTMICKT